ncbi:MlaD family protein [Comamonas terrigena]|nr:MlaD family protein [Comamonas terrigena]MDH0051444.1 MlaD family protein [Comamonas terrigena]MDH0511224.1 MlaD family protein [Comamonas terrigena]MDH1091472.1 MlaD family protein [Comamonas terrigena]MDH1293051.1 MlaD family protein [Comamonas terrigena]MDH1501710.1 MlaD family protein [Comamonas terrigena]
MMQPIPPSSSPTPDQPSAGPATPPLRPVAHLERKAAALLLLTCALVLGALVYLMYARGVFEPTQSLVLTADDSEGVVVGMDMTFSGFPIGRVHRIELAKDGMVRILIDVQSKDAHWLRESSVFTLVKGIVGGTTIKAYSGILTDPPLPPGAERPVLRGDATAEIPQIMASAKELLANLSQMTASDSSLGQSLEHIQSLSDKMQGPNGVLGAVMGNEADARRVGQVLERAEQVLARMDRMVQRADRQVFDADGVMPQVKVTVLELNGLLADARQSLKKMDAVLVEAQGIGSNVNSATQDLGELRTEVEANLRKIETMMTDLQRKWPFARQPELQLP